MKLVKKPTAAHKKRRGLTTEFKAKVALAALREAKAAGVWVFGGGINESMPPVMVAGDGTARQGTYPQTRTIEGGYSILELSSREDAIKWEAKMAVALSLCAGSPRVRVRPGVVSR